MYSIFGSYCKYLKYKLNFNNENIEIIVITCRSQPVLTANLYMKVNA